MMGREKKTSTNNEWVSSNTEQTAKSKSQQKTATNNEWADAHVKEEKN
ncbi:MAG: hypothetical protein ACRCWQ_03370 [Bacilli bacterium]